MGFIMNDIIPVLKSFLLAARTVHETWCLYKTKRNQHRIEKAQIYLRARVANLEERVRQLEEQPTDADLFLATLESLMRDDEEAKTCFYAAFLDHLLTESTDRSELRRVAECFKSLSSVELNYLGGTDESGKLPNIPEDWIKVSLPARLQSLGLQLDRSDSAYNTNLTSVGLLARSIAMEGKKALASQAGEGSS